MTNRREKTPEEQGYGFEGEHITLKGIGRILAAQPNSFQTFLDNADMPVLTMVALIEGFPRIAWGVGRFYRAQERLQWYARILQLAKYDGQCSVEKRWAAGVLRRNDTRWLGGFRAIIELMVFWNDVAQACEVMGSPKGVDAARKILAVIDEVVGSDSVGG